MRKCAAGTVAPEDPSGVLGSIKTFGPAEMDLTLGAFVFGNHVDGSFFAGISECIDNEVNPETSYIELSIDKDGVLTSGKMVFVDKNKWQGGGKLDTPCFNQITFTDAEHVSILRPAGAGPLDLTYIYDSNLETFTLIVGDSEGDESTTEYFEYSSGRDGPIVFNQIDAGYPMDSTGLCAEGLDLNPLGSYFKLVLSNGVLQSGEWMLTKYNIGWDNGEQIVGTLDHPCSYQTQNIDVVNKTFNLCLVGDMCWPDPFTYQQDEPSFTLVLPGKDKKDDGKDDGSTTEYFAYSSGRDGPTVFNQIDAGYPTDSTGLCAEGLDPNPLGSYFKLVLSNGVLQSGEWLFTKYNNGWDNGEQIIGTLDHPCIYQTQNIDVENKTFNLCLAGDKCWPFPLTYQQDEPSFTLILPGKKK